MSQIIFLSSDLMFSSRVLGAAKALDIPVQLVADPAILPEKLTANCRGIFIDLSLGGLDLPAAIAAIRRIAPHAQIVSFGAHVNEAALAAAKQAGCDLVLSRGQFNKQYAELLRDAFG